MNRPWQIWTTFGACLIVAIVAVGWLSVKALLVEQQAALEENTRLALWRMDSLMAPLVAQESARPYFTYTSFYSAERAYGRMFNRKGDADVTVPSPLLSQTNPFIRLHFQFDSADQLTSPEVPQGKFAKMAVPQYLSEVQSEDNGNVLKGLQKDLDFTALLADLPAAVPATATPELQISNGVVSSANVPSSDNSSQAFSSSIPNLPPPSDNQMPQQAANAAPSFGQQGQVNIGQQQLVQAPFDAQGSRGQAEYQARQRSVALNNSASQMVVNKDVAVPVGETPDVQMSMMTPIWLKGDLILARRVNAGTREFVQGCLLDWPNISQELLLNINDLLPAAKLVASANVDSSSSVRRLASLPVELIPGAPGSLFSSGLSPIKMSLFIAWAAMSLAALAVAILLRGVIALSERRAAFVSAVTHELRTPLTTFRMYAEMLSEGMVRDENDKKSYLQTLRIEADRLTHLVGNVLAYARLERGKPGGRIETITVEQLLKVATERLADRASQANLDLKIQPSDGVLLRWVKADPAAVEQILFNLVDNACKYATTATDRTLHLEVASQNGEVQIQLRDHGTGIPPIEHRRLFQAFHKSAQDAAGSAPGVGLGLALSKRLALDMHGDLRYVAAPDDRGACFVLTLPAAD
jgi:signal transduction histidine kinase